jgi:hypothetical protein
MLKSVGCAVVLCVAIGLSACDSAEAVSVQARVDPSLPGAWFVNTGCTTCHAVSVYGHKSQSSTGPDLSVAVEDVPRRFGRPLDEFVREPVGTMRLVFADQIRLSPEERAIAIRELQMAYQEFRRQSDHALPSSH